MCHECVLSSIGFVASWLLPQRSLFYLDLVTLSAWPVMSSNTERATELKTMRNMLHCWVKVGQCLTNLDAYLFYLSQRDSDLKARK